MSARTHTATHAAKRTVEIEQFIDWYKWTFPTECRSSEEAFQHSV